MRRLPCTAGRRGFAERGERAAPGAGSTDSAVGCLSRERYRRVCRKAVLRRSICRGKGGRRRHYRPSARQAQREASIRTVPQIRGPRQAAPPGVWFGEHAGSSRPPFAAHRGHRSAEPPSNAAHGRALRRRPARSFAACRVVSFQPAGSGGGKPAAKRPKLPARCGAVGKSASSADSFTCGGEVYAREIPPHRRKLRCAVVTQESAIHSPVENQKLRADARRTRVCPLFASGASDERTLYCAEIMCVRQMLPSLKQCGRI